VKKELDIDDTQILYIGTYPPRECGIATFTKDLSSSIDKRSPSLKSKIIAMNNNGVNIYNYSKKVVYQMSDTDMNDYIETAKKINTNPEIKLICIQHEFGIFGGVWGDYLLAFLEIIEKPVVITFHSVLPNPDNKLKKVVLAISECVQEIVVMTRTAVNILREEYGVDTPIKIIPHGIPTTPFENQEKEKKRLGYENNIILSSFGMLSRGKGYEQVIDALPEIVKEYPNLLYLIIGETHPIVRKKDGEEYRNFLTRKIKKLGLEKNVKFYNKYLALEEIIQYLKATDIYISSSTNPNQITSGTLAYAMGCGRAVISTPFLHAKDALSFNKGIIVKMGNSDSFNKAILSLLRNPNLREEMEKESYYYTRHMTWPNVAISYSRMFSKYIGFEEEKVSLPKIDTSHLVKLTDKFGIIQFSVQSTPDKNSGYTLDDNARAILICTKHYDKFKEYDQLSLIKTYLDYIDYVQKEDGRLLNFVDKRKKIDEKNWSEDAHGRAIWALGYLISSQNIPEDFKRDAEVILLKALKPLNQIKSPRALSFMIMGLYYYNQTKNLPSIKALIKEFADGLLKLYETNSSEKWKWFENYLSYGNSKLPEALLYAYLSTHEDKFLEVGLESLDFLSGETFIEGVFAPIGQNGWYEQNKKRAYYDQQPIEAAYMVQTLILAYKITHNRMYKNMALKAFQWFIGKNSLNQVVYNESTGGCFDGIGENSINLNQGAESTISFLLARLSLTDFDSKEMNANF
jgi:glycosyltransferase involved in cell wall biosynthesis